MTEKMDELYKKYFEERLNLIFFGGNGVSFKKSFYAPYEPKEKITVEPPKGYAIIGEFHEGFAIIRLTNTRYLRLNYIDKDGKILENKYNFWNSADNFKGGYARVRFEAFRGFIDTNGNIVPYDYIKDAFDDCFIRRIPAYGYWEQLDKNGNVLYTSYDELQIKGNYILIGEHKYRPRKIEMGNYNVKKNISGYTCSNSIDKYHIKYKPIKKYGYRYTLCHKKCIIYLYDRVTNSYNCLGRALDFSYDDHFIYDNKNKKIYLIYGEQMIDITEYYNKHLLDKESLSITNGISIISKELFFINNVRDITQLIEKEKEEDKKRKIEDEKQAEYRKIKELKKQEEEEKNNMVIEQGELLQQIKNNLERLKELDKKLGTYKKIKMNDLLVDVGDHKEINPLYLESGLLKYIDLSMVSFNNVKLSGIDFRGCNIILLPDQAYNKDLSNSNFEGLYIDPVMSFYGVDIRGSKFSQDNDERTIDRGSITFKDAIYDETTTFNGVPFTTIFGECKNNDEPKNNM